jgi:MATE family multidrug resistance protein
MFNRQDLKLLLILAIPLMLSGLTENSIGFFSTLFLAHLGQQQLAAGALVNWIFATLMVILWGILSAISVSVAHRHGAQDHVGVGKVFRDSIYLSILFSIPATLLIWNLAPILLWLGQSPSIVAIAIPYLHALAWGLLPDFLGIVLLQLVIGLGHTRTSMCFTFVWVPINIISNYVLVFGQWGFPAFGIAGTGWGMSFSFWLTTLGFLAFICCRQPYKIYCQQLWTRVDFAQMWGLIKSGLPMGMMYCVEVSFFTVMVLLIGHMGAEAIAANQIAMQYLGLMIAVVFAVAQAITVRVSNRLGANEPAVANRAVYAGIVSISCLMLVVMLFEWLGSSVLVGFDFDLHDPNNVRLIAQAKLWLALSSIVLFIEAIRFALFGALRGLKDTRFPLLVSIISFWGIALPVGYWLAYHAHLGAAGFWVGLMLSASFSVLLLWSRCRVKMRTIIMC